VGWTFYNSSGQRLSSKGKVPVSDLADGTDGELITWGTDAAPTTVAAGTSGQVLTSGGANAVPTFQAAAGGGATTREGGNLSEASTTSTSAGDLLVSDTLTLQAIEPADIVYVGRVETGSTEEGNCGLKMNSTVTGEAVGAAITTGWNSGAGNEEEQGGAFIWLGPRLTNYETLYGGQGPRSGGSGTHVNTSHLTGLTGTALLPVVEITSVTIRGILDGSGGRSLSADELHVYGKSTS